MVVVAVMRGSPAFKADVLPGDIVQTINGSLVYDPTTFKAAWNTAQASGKAGITLIRSGKTMEKEADPAWDP